MALWSVAFLGLRPVASLTDGAIAGAFGVRPAGRRARDARSCSARPGSTSYNALTVPLRSGRSVPRMELHFIADDLEEHAWYVDLVADFVEQVELYLRYVAARRSRVESLAAPAGPMYGYR